MEQGKEKDKGWGQGLRKKTEAEEAKRRQGTGKYKETAEKSLEVTAGAYLG